MAEKEDSSLDLQEEQDQAESQQEPEAPQEEVSDEEKLMARLQEALAVQVEDLGPLRKKLSITIPRSLIDERLGEQFAELKREAMVPGFRRGRAPLRLVEKRFGHDVGDELSAQLVSNGYLAAVKKLELDPLGDPLVWAQVREPASDESGMNKTVVTEKLVTVEKALDHLRLPKEGDFAFSCEVELRPEFDLPDLEGIAVTRPVLTVTDQDVETEIKRRLAFRGRFEPVEGGRIEANDLLIGDLKVVVDGQAVKSETNAMIPARDQVYEGLSLDGWGKLVVGQPSGATVSLEVTFPEDYETPDLRGKHGTLEFTIHDLKRLAVPDLTSQLLEELGFEDESELHNLVKTDLEVRANNRVREAMRGQVIKYLVERTSFELPEKLSRQQTDAIVYRRMVDMLQAGLPEAEVNQRVDELRLRAAKEAEDDLKLFFLMDKIAQEREIDVSEDELNGAIAAMAGMRNMRFDRMRDELIKSRSMTALYLRIRDGKILDSLLDAAQIEDQPPAQQKD